MHDEEIALGMFNMPRSCDNIFQCMLESDYLWGRKRAHLLILDFERGQSGLQLLVPEHELCLDRLLGADLTHLVGGIRNHSYNRAIELASRGMDFLLRRCLSHTDPL